MHKEPNDPVINFGKPAPEEAPCGLEPVPETGDDIVPGSRQPLNCAVEESQDPVLHVIELDLDVVADPDERAYGCAVDIIPYDPDKAEYVITPGCYVVS